MHNLPDLFEAEGSEAGAWAPGRPSRMLWQCNVFAG